ncbi:hypothetical protein CEXT_180801 [Caerostris extrusa]|uniref:Uncharacterized protein n=1 Tax=Caerostris extrusa TaxID=172846 RepID=A0AAV4MDU4_CAEEX|nr:hypothetical protein CEXT_180801 [Caerostris extrusa]
MTGWVVGNFKWQWVLMALVAEIPDCGNWASFERAINAPYLFWATLSRSSVPFTEKLSYRRCARSVAAKGFQLIGPDQLTYQLNGLLTDNKGRRAYPCCQLYFSAHNGQISGNNFSLATS